MHAIRQKCRPKHQVLILNCYPRTVKGAVDVKPNSSELSYLLYYATTRRSKVQKVGAFLEKKTASDVWRARIGNVQVTLQIVASLIEKAPRDLPLYASHVLKILNIILTAHDITLVESSLPTFQSFCKNHNEASLSADQGYLCQYQDIVSKYASLASANPSLMNPVTSAPLALRWKNAGLQAIKSVVSSEALASVAGRLVNLIIPTLLDNLWSQNSDYINLLEQKSQVEERLRSKSFSRRRTSVTTVKTIETLPDTRAALSKTTLDADKVAEADITTLSLECLKLAFVVNNKAQIHSATMAILKYIGERGIDQKENSSLVESRAIQIFQMISRWAPVQDRYTILVTTMEILLHSASESGNFEKQLLFATVIDSLLRSDINLIGLNVLDILLGLVQHLLHILQSSRPPSQEANIMCKVNTTGDGQWPLKNSAETLVDSALKLVLKKKLLEKLQDCIGDLATHIYYADQISDMVSALLCRIKPWANGNMTTLTSATETAALTSTMTTNQTSDLDHSNFDGHFLFNSAKVSALKAIKSILLTAGLRKSLSGIRNLSRNYVSTRVWEGTHWLLRDNDNNVRRAYVAALLTWMKYEISKSDIRMFDGKLNMSPQNVKLDTNIFSNHRSMSSTWPKEKAITKSSTQSTFFEQLHLAIYENALKYPESEEDIIISYILLHTLVENLDIDAVKNGLPMIFRLQEDICEAMTPLAKIQISCLCYGYFWTLSEKFKLTSTPIDIEIHREVHRRKKNQLWISKIRCPPPCFEQIRTMDKEDPSQELSLKNFHSDSLRPFKKRTQMVELIFSSYVETLMAQTANSSSSPTRSQSISEPFKPCAELNLSETVKEQLMSEWSPESVAAQQSIRSESLNGSKTRTSTLKSRNILTMSATDRSYSPPGYNQSSLGYKNGSRSSSNHRQGGGLGPFSKTRRANEFTPSTTSESRGNSITRVDFLRRVLSGEERRVPRDRMIGNMTPSDASSESLVSYPYTASDISFNPSQSNLSQLEFPATDREPSKLIRSKSCDEESRFVAPLSSNPVLMDERSNFLHNSSKDVDNTVPPIPSIPRLYKDEFTIEQSDFVMKDNKSPSAVDEKRPASRSQETQFTSKESLAFLETFLKEIEICKSEGTNGYVAKPPY